MWSFCIWGLDEISESEGLDRANMKMPQSQIDLLNAVAEVNANVVVVMSAGSSVEMPWLDKCKALVHGYLCGQAGASAVLKVILGQVNPSGKLNETYPVVYEDTPSVINRLDRVLNGAENLLFKISHGLPPKSYVQKKHGNYINIGPIIQAFSRKMRPHQGTHRSNRKKRRPCFA